MVLSRRILRVINIFIAVSGLAVMGGVWWFFVRPLPKVSGQIAAPVATRVDVGWDELGAPHIRAGNQEDALFAQGYVTASERLWQMDALRRSAAGDLSEIVGAAALKLDQNSRRLRMRRIAESVYVNLSANDRADMSAYARGVNYFIDTNRSRLSFEFAALHYTPRPWSVVDTILIGLYMYRDLTTSWTDHLERRDLLANADPAKVAYLFPVRAGDEIQPGSNAWVVSGVHTAHGHPQLSNDMHLEYSIPGIWFMVGLEAPGLKVAGVSLPGAPGVIVGHNQRIAWGVTNLHFNVQDLYRENLDERTGQYEFEGRTEQARLERDLIQVKGQNPVEFRQWVTRHGPVIVNESGEHLALRWTAADPSLFHFTFVDIDHARNWKEFTAALSGFPGPGQNFVYADVGGNIGYHATGKLPVRHGFTGDVPLNGADGKSEWDGFIPFEQLPSAFNPPSGIIATANQNPFPASYPFTVSGGFASPYRSRQIFALLRAKAKLNPADALAIQKDVYSGFEDHLAQAVISAWNKYPAQNKDLSAAVDLFRNFGGQMDQRSPGAFLIVLTDRYVRSAMSESVSPGSGSIYVNGPTGGGPFQMSYSAAERLLRERPPGWVNDYDQMLLDSLRAAWQEAQRRQGRNATKWEYGRYLRLEIDQPVAKQIPGLGSYFNIGPVPMSGSSTTVKQTTSRLGPSERFTAVVGDWDRSILNVPVGESGHLFSKHYRDEWDAYYNGQSFPMQFDHVDVKSTLTLLPN